MQGDPYLWLVIGGLLSIFVSGRWMIAAAGWLAPLFLLHYAHAALFWPALFGLWLAVALAIGLANWRVIPVPVFIYPLVVLFLSASVVLPYCRPVGAFTARLLRDTVTRLDSPGIPRRTLQSWHLVRRHTQAGATGRFNWSWSCRGVS